MRQFARVLFIALGGLFLLIALLIFGANLYIQSTFSQARLEEQISRAIHVPVKITSTSVSPFRGLTVAGITVAQPNQAITGNLFQAKNLTVRFKFWPIFRRLFIVREVVLTSPTVAWWQDEKGRWQLPKMAPLPTATPVLIASASSTPPAAPLPSSSAAEPENAPLPEAAPPRAAGEKPAKKAPKFQVTLQKVRLDGGNFYFYDHAGNAVASFEEVNATAPEPSPDKTKGDVHIETVTLRGPAVLEDVTSPLRYEDERLALPEITARLADGQLSGAFHANVGESGTPFHTDLQFSQVDLHRLLAQLGTVPVDLQGRAQGWMQLRGQMSKRDSLLGSGQLIVNGGQMRNYSFLQVLSDALRIEELGIMNLQTAQADFRVVGNRIWIDSLVLQSQNLRVLVWGSMKIGGQMKLQARLTINEKISRQLPQFVEQSFQPIPGTDQRTVDFSITGKYDRPKTDLVDRLLGKSLEKKASKALDIFRGFMGNGGGKKKNEP